MLKRISVVAALGLALLAACGEEEPSATSTGDSSASPTAAGEPACTEIWVDGATLPDPYKGCYDEAGFVKAERLPCSSGQVVVTYADRSYAVPGNRVNDEGSLATSKQFGKVKAQCGA
jgi:hypothetical protein